MGKVNIVEKDGKKYIDGEEVLLEIEYSVVGRLLALSFRVFGILLGLFFLLAFQSYIVKIISIFIIFLFILDFLGILFFKKLIFTDSKIIKYSNTFLKEKSFFLNYKEMETTVAKRFFGGTLMFWKKFQRMKTIWHFKFDLLPITNHEFKEIRNILKNKNIIEGVQDGWNY